MCDCLGGESNPTIESVNDEIDSFTKSMIKDERDKVAQQWLDGFVPSGIITFPPPYTDNAKTRIAINVFDDDEVPNTLKNIFEIPSIDEYYGDLGFFDNMCYYGKYSDGVFGYSFDENAEPTSKLDWTAISQINDNLTEARNYFNAMIAEPVYGVSDVTKLQPIPPALKQRKKQLNDWEEVDIANLGNKNQILSALLGDNFDGDTSDMWLSLIAFSGYGSHRTGPIKKDDKHPTAYFVNDVTFLANYGVRPGYELYGAAAYFDSKYHLTEIYLSSTDRTYKSPKGGGDDTTSSAEWLHAKWAWKVSVSVATFLVDMVAHSRFRESSGLIKAIQTHLNINHNIRRLLLPFTLGTIYANRIFNEYLRKDGLYSRAFAFKYGELQRLIRDSMTDAPQLKQGDIRKPEDKMKYRFRLFRKKVVVMKKLPDEIYPIYTDVWDFWVQTLKFVEEYIQIYYNADDKDDKLLENDIECVNFYKSVLENLGIANKYRLKKFNIINILTHFICNATIWNHHISTSVSFEYSVDPDFTGLKIVGNNAKQTNVSNYVEYCLVSISKGWQFSNMQIPGNIVTNNNNNNDDEKAETAQSTQSNTGWDIVLLGGDEKDKTREIFKAYFVNSLDTLKKNIEQRNNIRIAPYNGCNPRYLQSSIML